MPGNFLSPMANATTSEVSRDGMGALATRSLVSPSISRAFGIKGPAADLADGAGLLQRLEFRLGDEAIEIERRLRSEIADADEGDVGLGCQRQGLANHRLVVQQFALLCETRR